MTAGWVVEGGIRRVHVEDLEQVQADWQKQVEKNHGLHVTGYDRLTRQTKTWAFSGGTPLQFEPGDRE